MQLSAFFWTGIPSGGYRVISGQTRVTSRLPPQHAGTQARTSDAGVSAELIDMAGLGVTATGRARADKLIFGGVRRGSQCPPSTTHALSHHHSFALHVCGNITRTLDAHAQAHVHYTYMPRTPQTENHPTSPVARKSVPGLKHAIPNSASHQGTGPFFPLLY